MLTFPITNVCCERSLSSLRRLKTWERATMGEERLCGLVMLHVHRDMNVSRENILRRFDETGHKKIGTLHFEWQFMYSNHTYYIYRTLSYYSVEFILICFFHWTHNHYMTSFFWMVILTTKTTTLITRVRSFSQIKYSCNFKAGSSWGLWLLDPYRDSALDLMATWAGAIVHVEQGLFHSF
jgi:hypothetical protein